MDKLILTDVDGVLLNWNKAFDDHMSKLGYAEDKESINRYSLAKRYNVPRQKMDKIVDDFNNSESILTLEPFRDAVKGVKLLESLGFRFIAISNLGSSTESWNNRNQNIRNIFGDVLCDLITLPIGESKYSTLSKWENSNYYWIEDKFSNALDGHSLGLKSILVDADYNRDFQTNRFPRVSNETPWKDIVNIMVNDYFGD